MTTFAWGKMKKRIINKMKLTGTKVCKVALLVGCFFLYACKNKTAVMPDSGEYLTLQLKPTNQGLVTRYSSTIRGRQDIEIRPQVSGFITRLLVDEGSIVKKGQTLFVIDQVPFKAALESAIANVESARASVATAQLTFESKEELFKQNVTSAFDLQTAKNTLAMSKAALKLAEAQQVTAQNNFSYTEVKSPSNGVVGSIPFRIGSLVSPSMVEPLTTVSDNSEMYVYFSMTEKQLLNLGREHSSLKEAIATMPAIELELSDGKLYAHKGKIETISGVIDARTGAVSLRATFPNPEQLLRTGGSGVVLFPYNQENCLVIPQSATYEIQDRKFVYRVDSSKAVSTQVDIFPINNGKEFIVTKGLSEGDVIVLDGIATLKDGTAIKTK